MPVVQIHRNISTATLAETVKATIFSYTFDATNDTASIPDEAHRLVDGFTVAELLEAAGITDGADPAFTGSYAFERTGWQSWDAGWEIGPDEKVPRYKSFAIPAMKKYIEVPETVTARNIELAQFIMYLRWENRYLVLASTGKGTPPVQYRLDRKADRIDVEVYATGKTWKDGEQVAEITVFLADGFFQLKDAIRTLYRDNRFDDLSFLGKRPGGWESWYNHYNHIDRDIILEDVEALDRTENLLKQMYVDRGQPLVFQIDDGWQQGTGQWEINEDRFPGGLAPVTELISSKGYIPGLWIAPFIADYRTTFIQEHEDWLLRDRKGRPVPAGFNPSWGCACGKLQPAQPHNYFVLDLSRDDVLAHLDALMDRAINSWGFRYLKLDFLFAGMLNGVFKNGGAAYQWYERAIATITKRKMTDSGKPVAYLGCGMPFEGSFRHLPLSRIGSDTLEGWDRGDMRILDFVGRPGAYLNLKDTIGHAFWNESVFLNDPDVVFFRQEGCTLTENEKELIALTDFMLGGQIMLSDDPATFSETTDGPFTRDMLALYDKLDGKEFGNMCLEPDVYAVFTRDGTVSGIINLTDADYTLPVDELPSGTTAGDRNTRTADKPPVPLSKGGAILETAEGPVCYAAPHSILLFEN